jgi:hypothetical protein
MALPGWYSLSSAVEIHAALEGIAVIFFVALVAFDVWAHLDKGREHILEGIGLVCFAIAILAEVCAYPYSRRSDKLSAEANVIAEGKIAALNKEAGNARKEAGEANERAAKLEKGAASLHKIAEDERLARIRLAEQIAWRTPDLALITQLAPPLKRFAGQRYAIVSEPGEPERSSMISWIVILLSPDWKMETATSVSELKFIGTNIVLWVSPAAPNTVLEAARALVPAMERGGLPAVVLQSGWGPEPDVAPPELIRVVIFKKGPRMTITGNVITFEESATKLFFGNGPPH